MDIPSWALEDVFLAGPNKLLFDQFLAEGNFPEDLKKLLLQFLKDGTTLCLRTTDQCHLPAH